MIPNDVSNCIGNNKRVHVLALSKSLEEIATFFSSVLLLSHSIRRDAVAVAAVKKDLWICAPGSKVKHLRPDVDSAVGWVRAVLRSKRDMYLGAVKLQGGLLNVLRKDETYDVVCDPSFKSCVHSVKSISNSERLIFVYLKNDVTNVYNSSRVLKLPITCDYAPILINIIVDRLEEGKRSLVF